MNRQQQSRKSVKDGKYDVCVKQENDDGTCLRSRTTSLNMMNSALSQNYVKLDKWIIKPLGDGVCVEGHRRLPNF